MLRVGLTGNLGSGKSTVAGLFAARGAHVLQSDAIGKEMMQPGQAVFDAIVGLFGPGVVLADGTLDRRELARLAFAEGRAEELNGIVHPAVIARQAEIAAELAETDPDAVLVVESALLFDPKKLGERDPRPWRFDRVVLVTAPEADKVARFVGRAGGGEEAEAEARRRLALQIPDETAVRLADHVLTNGGSLSGLEAQVEALWQELRREAQSPVKSLQ